MKGSELYIKKVPTVSVHTFYASRKAWLTLNARAKAKRPLYLLVTFLNIKKVER